MSCERIDRLYVEKLLSEIEDAIKDVEHFTSKSFDNTTEAERYAVYSLIVMAEALVSLCIHIARRVYEEKPETPLHCYRVLRDKGLLSSEEFDDFVKFLKLRNLLVHKYWIIDDKKIFDSVKILSIYVYS